MRAWTASPHRARAPSARHSFKGGLPDPTKDDGTAARLARAEKEMWESFSPAERTVKTAERAAITTLCEGRIAEALEQFDVALENSDGNRLLWQRGIALYFDGRWEDAANDFERNAETFEEMIGEPATEYLIWRAAALLPQLARGDERRATPPRHQPVAAGARRALAAAAERVRPLLRRRRGVRDRAVEARHDRVAEARCAERTV